MHSPGVTTTAVGTALPTPTCSPRCGTSRRCRQLSTDFLGRRQSVQYSNRSHVAMFRRAITVSSSGPGGLLNIGKGVVNSAANLVPSVVPRPVAKAGVVGVGGLVLLSLIGRVVSTVFFFGAIAGALYLWSRLASGRGETSGSGEGGDDALEEAKRIMNKYK